MLPSVVSVAQESDPTLQGNVEQMQLSITLR
mgnify:CR=1 FL=1|jgi:hypothetical protein